MRLFLRLKYGAARKHRLVAGGSLDGASATGGDETAAKSGPEWLENRRSSIDSTPVMGKRFGGEDHNRVLSRRFLAAHRDLLIRFTARPPGWMQKMPAAQA
jgi:hypothetical protein